MASKKQHEQGMNWIRPGKRESIYARDKYTCAYCEKKRGENYDDGEPVKLTLDHVTPRSKGGGNEDTNLVTCCHRCNTARGNIDLGDFDKSGKVAAKVALITSKHERFKVESVHRRDLRNAPYNPRKISPEARKRLKEGIAEVGLVEPLVWNRTTGNLLSGHQRISIIDELEGTNDYLLDVSVVEISDRKEKALNVFFNNASSQGEFDMAALETLIRDLGSDVKGTGFEADDLSFLINELEPTKPAAGKEPALDRLGDNLENQLVVYFEDGGAVHEFLRTLNKPPGERYVKGEDVARLLGVAL